MTTRRKPVPASGDPLPDAIEAADATPPATDTTTTTTTEGGESNAGGEQATSDAPATDTGAADQASGNADQVSDEANAASSTSEATDQPAGADQPVETDQPITPPATEPQKPAEPEIVDARVLLAFEEHAADDVISAPAPVIEQLKLAGRVDPHPDAVAYARSLHA